MDRPPDITIELEFKPDVTAQDIKDWFIWESARIRKGDSYPSLIYIGILDFLFTNKHISAKEALRYKTTLGQVVKRRRGQLELNALQLSKVAKVTSTHVANLESGKASISAYGVMFIALESYALFKGFKDAVGNMEHLMSRTPNLKRGVSVAA